MADRPVEFKSGFLQAGFTQVPNVLLVADLTMQAKLAWATLAMYAWDSAQCFPGQERLAASLGVSDRQLRTYLKELRDAGWLTIERRGMKKTNRYILDIPRPSDRKHTSDQDRKHTSDKEDAGGKDEGAVVTEEISKETPEVMSRASASASNGQDSFDVGQVSRPAYNFNRKKMTRAEWAIVEVALALFNETFETDFGPQDKDQVSRVVGVIRSGGLKGMSVDALRLVLQNNAKAPWWGAEKPDTVGVIFGPRTWARARRCDGRLTGKNAVSAQRESVMSRLDAIIAEGETP